MALGFFDLAGALISGVWRFFTGLEVPGLIGVTFAALFVTVFLATLGIRLIFFAFGIFSAGDSPRTSSTRKPRISEKRKGDEF